MRLHGDPHFNCPSGGTAFDFDGDLDFVGERQYYSLLSDTKTRAAVNVAFLAHSVSVGALVKTFSHTVGMFISGYSSTYEPITIELSYKARENSAPKHILPTLHVNGKSIDLKEVIEGAHPNLESTLSVKQQVCTYMQPAKFLAATLMRAEYKYKQAKNVCTQITITLENMELDVIAVPAAYGACGLSDVLLI